MCRAGLVARDDKALTSCRCTTSNTTCLRVATTSTTATTSQSNFTQGRIAAAHGRFSRIRQAALMNIPFSTPNRQRNRTGADPA